MQIAIDLTSLYNRRRTGMESYAIDLYRALLTTQHTIIPIFNTKNELDDNENARIIECVNNRVILENIALSKTVRKINADMILFPVFPPPIDLYVACKSKIIPTIHDTAFLHYRNTLNFAAKYYLTPKYKLALKHADCIISISETARKQLEDYTELPVINLGENISGDFYNASEKASSICLKKWNLKPCEYIISVSTLEPRKNIKYLLDVFHDFITKKNLKLVLVGRKGWSKDDELQELLKQYAENIVFTSYVETTELFSLYRFANAFVLLSLDEGFGRTPLEAIACGCRKILVSDIDIFHETLGSSANYLPLYDANKCRMLLKKFASFRNVEDTLKIPFSVIEDSLKNWDLLKLKH